MSGWQPIETAPKDGTPILIFQPSGQRNSYMPIDALKEGEFTYRWDDPRLLWFDDARWAIGYWRPYPNGGWGNRNSATVTPSHWMPLPTPPEQAAEQSA